ncbi:hypothetical protein BKA69DRAFT_515494 [Paraphysoderma sedebokerense]|nr:hypothetical protein BKA69DRAFT_515494 [Paraphysoderma sedebokerense]
MDPNSEFFSVEYRRLSRQFKTRYEEYSRLHDILTNSKERVEEFTKLAKKLEECESRSKSKQNGMINGHGNGNGNGKVHGDVNGTSKDKEEEAKIRREFKKLYEKWNGKEVERTVERFKKLHEEVAGLKEKILGMHKLVEQSR